FNHHRQSQSASMNDISIASLLASDDITSYKRRWNLAEEEYKHTKKYHKKPTINQRTTLTCFHATVAQKSYGTEKRFLCPPPIVHIASNEKYSKKIQLSMSVICENGGKILEQRSMLDENQSGSFKYLHVTGTAKAKHFYLKVNLLPITKNDHLTEESLASFISKPISIISKPSKKTAKTRNISTCILAHSTVSLFNRINSQTVRTKYMTSSNNMLCAKNSSWSPFNIIIVNQPNLPHSHKLSSKQHDHFTSRIQLSRYSSLSNQQDNVKIPHHLTYGTEIILKDAHTGVTSPSLIIRKVDKGRIIQSAYGPVSQMQKIALQLASTVHTQQPIYLSASGSIAENNNGGELDNSTNSSINHSTWLDYSPSKMVQSGNNSPISYEEVDDYLCWTIVGINKFEHITPLPLLTSVEYQYNHHTLNVVGQHLIQAAPVPRLLDLWLGTHGPLLTRLSQPPQPHKPHEIHWSVQLPSTRDLLAANHDLIMTKENKKSLELTLLLVRQQDGMVYHTGK
ncbi:beta-trefoil DNA-binding domain-containing protein, partial [Cokeromyces recurvatus]|uniref:beta-trefoil DNA-binding domain-containing protein n=1 Tax=Cokeromyces recurvatus TaxID=90255 RepID=UPI00221EF0D1